MTARYTHEVPIISIWSQDTARRVAVTLPAPPMCITLNSDHRPETAPCARTIRGDAKWQNDPVLRHAATRKDRV